MGANLTWSHAKTNWSVTQKTQRKVLGTVSLSAKSKNGLDQDLIFHVVETNQPGLLGLRSSQDLGFIKVIMMTNAEEEETEPGGIDKQTKSSQKLKEAVLQKYVKVLTRLGRLGKPYHIK